MGSNGVEVRGGASQLQEGRASACRFHQPNPNLHAIVEEVQPAAAAMQHASLCRSAENFGNGGLGPVRRGHDLDVADHVLSTAQRSARQCPFDAGDGMEPIDDSICDAHRSSQGDPRHQHPQSRQSGGDGGFGCRIEARQNADPLFANQSGQVVGGRHTQRQMDSSELLDGDRSGFVQPTKVGRQIGDR
jgi:hypothetical protein